MTKLLLHASIGTTSRRHPSALNRFALAGVAVAVFLTGCSATSEGDKASTQSDGVASLSDAGRSGTTPPTSSPDKPTAGEAPQIRLDTTDSEKLHMWQPYLHCLKDHDVPSQTAGATIKSASGSAMPNPDDPGLLWYSGADLSKYPGAGKACTKLRPLGPPELDPKQNPEYMDDFRAQMKCMEKQGLQVKPNADGSGYRLPDFTTETERIAQDCQMKAFGGK